jgi:hypothetical protein
VKWLLESAYSSGVHEDSEVRLAFLVHLLGNRRLQRQDLGSCDGQASKGLGARLNLRRCGDGVADSRTFYRR